MKVAEMHAGVLATIASGGVDVIDGHDVEPPGKTSRVKVAKTVVDTVELEVLLTVSGSVHSK